MTISNIKIETIAKNIKLNIIVICKDELKEQYPSGNYIVNLNNKDENGSHWVSFVIHQNIAFYFDSFGAQPPQEFITYCKKFKLKLCCNTYIIQNINSSNCGYYCLGLIVYLHKNNAFNTSKKFISEANDFINLFEDNTKLNDKILFDYLKNNIRPKKYITVALEDFEL